MINDTRMKLICICCSQQHKRQENLLEAHEKDDVFKISWNICLNIWTNFVTSVREFKYITFKHILLKYED